MGSTYLLCVSSLQSLPAGHGLWLRLPVSRSGTLDDEGRLRRDMKTWGFLVVHWQHFAAFAVISALVPMAYPYAVEAANPVIVADAFSRTVSGGWGSANTGGPWILEGGSGVFSVNGTVGSVSLAKAGANRAALQNGPSARDVDIRLRVRGTQPAGGQLFAYVVSRRSSGNEFRSKLIYNANGTLAVHSSRYINGTETSLAPQVTVPGLNQASGAFFNLRTLVSGANPTTIQIKAWADGATEPSSWQFTASSTAAQLQVPGTTGLRMYLNTTVTNAPATLTFDDVSVESLDTPPPPLAGFSWAEGADWLTVDFTDTSTGSPTSWTWDFGDGGSSTARNPSHSYAAEGTYAVTLTATNAGGPGSTSHDVEVVEPPPPPPQTIVAADSFGRTKAGSWWIADEGGLYSYSGTFSDFAVNGSAGTVRLPSAGASRAAFLFSPLVRDVEFSMIVSTDKKAAGGSFYIYAALRRQTDGAAYRPKIRVAPDGSVFAHAGRFLPSGEASLGLEQKVPGLVHAGGVRLHIRAQAIGASPTTIRLRVWADGQPEPDVWHFMATDSTAALQNAGALGVLAHVAAGSSTAPLVVTLDDLLATTTEQVNRVTGETLAVAGDIASCSSNGDNATANLLDMLTGTVATLGDNVYLDATASDFSNCYGPTWGRHKARTYPAIGNHEYRSASDAGPYFDYFGSVAGQRAKGWYAYDIGRGASTS